MALPVDRAGRERLLVYLRELRLWNRSINLVARRTTPAEMVERHFLDSLTLLNLTDRYCTRGALLDIGTGAGFPGLAVAAARPGLEVILVEPRGKRVTFLRHIRRQLALERVLILAGRLEEVLDRPELHRAGLVTSRALAEPARFLNMVKVLLRRGSPALLMLAGQEPILPREYRTQAAQRFILPFSRAERELRVIVRQKKTLSVDSSPAQ